MKARMRWMAVAVGVSLAAACATTQVTSTWRDPGVGPVRFGSVVGVALSHDGTLRRIAEDEFVSAAGPSIATAGYAVIPDEEELRDRDRARARIEAAGADGVVVFRLASAETVERWVPPTYYGNAWGYWGTIGPMVYEPGYLATDTIVQVEASAYRVSDARLVWSARSRTINPRDAEQLVDEVVRAVVEQMREDGLIPPAE